MVEDILASASASNWEVLFWEDGRDVVVLCGVDDLALAVLSAGIIMLS